MVHILPGVRKAGEGSFTTSYPAISSLLPLLQGTPYAKGAFGTFIESIKIIK
jgi:hypothetical protein